MYKNKLFRWTLLGILIGMSFPAASLQGQDITVKTNLLYDVTTTFNLGAEFRLSKHFTLDVPLNYNPWTFSDNKKLKHIMVQPELRYWLCESFYSHFFGFHALYSHYNMGGLDLPGGVLCTLKDYRYQGDMYGMGLSWGYQWVLSRRWSLEASIGMGYIHMEHDKYECKTCGDKIGKSKHEYLGPTKVALNLIYVIK
ncbi:hypothetical protein JCM10512_2563 [Bacteroides reticulotermitis JCM 10512]|uniref:DUF3575 domain-containing protein n=2 Tax=Bacteroides reticulotermitis TaxID=1133319 RepID=W4UUN6_9BACE|nr:hypothetical protein JCM10512_2563 [Bacteroides reticulotermitis JCM 10512]